MLEILNFMFSDFWHFVGCWLILIVIIYGITNFSLIKIENNHNDKNHKKNTTDTKNDIVES